MTKIDGPKLSTKVPAEAQEGPGVSAGQAADLGQAGPRVSTTLEPDHFEKVAATGLGNLLRGLPGAAGGPQPGGGAAIPGLDPANPGAFAPPSLRTPGGVQESPFTDVRHDPTRQDRVDISSIPFSSGARDQLGTLLAEDDWPAGWSAGDAGTSVAWNDVFGRHHRFFESPDRSQRTHTITSPGGETAVEHYDASGRMIRGEHGLQDGHGHWVAPPRVTKPGADGRWAAGGGPGSGTLVPATTVATGGKGSPATTPSGGTGASAGTPSGGSASASDRPATSNENRGTSSSTSGNDNTASTSSSSKADTTSGNDNDSDTSGTDASDRSNADTGKAGSADGAGTKAAAGPGGRPDDTSWETQGSTDPRLLALGRASLRIGDEIVTNPDPNQAGGGGALRNVRSGNPNQVNPGEGGVAPTIGPTLRVGDLATDPIPDQDTLAGNPAGEE